MSVGTRSLLFGAHQFLWHPLLVLIAWVKLYGWPRLGELVAIFVHDWGYAGVREIEGPGSLRHPEFGARIVNALFGPAYRDLVLYHSRDYARAAGASPSRLCWADKLSFALEPMRFYLWRTRLSGELREYRARAAKDGVVPAHATDEEWFLAVKQALLAQVEAAVRADVGPVLRPAAGNGD